MFVILFGSIVAFYTLYELVEISPAPKGTIHYQHLPDQTLAGPVREDVNVEPLSVQRFHNVVRQAFDYSCGSAALTTVLNFYLGRNFQEREVMEGLLQYGETDRIVQRRGFSLLDMKRLVTALGHPSGGFRAEVEDLVDLDHPAIAPIVYAGFKHFVVVKTVHKGHVYVADPSLGNISFTLDKFVDIWDRNVLFIVFPNGNKPVGGLELREEDMRIVDEATITHLAFQQFPQLEVHLQHALDNELSRGRNNALFRPASIETFVDENGEVQRRVIPSELDTTVSPEEFDAVEGNTVKRLHFKRN